jgi:acyl-CoA-binding protein
MQTTNVNVVDLQIDDKYLQTLFDVKAEKMRNLTIKIENETKLKFYGLYKVATVGPVSDKDKNSVGYFDFTEKYKM